MTGKITEETPIDALGLSERLRNCLFNMYAEVKKVSYREVRNPLNGLPPPKIKDFMHFTEAEMLRWSNFGRKSLAEWNGIICQIDNSGVPYDEGERALRTLAKQFQELSRLHAKLSTTNNEIAKLIGVGTYT